MANISMSNPLPPPSVLKVVQREAGKAAIETVAKPASAESNTSGKQRLEGVPSSKLNELQQLTEQAFVADDLRLSISFEKSIGRFVYRGVDRETGEIVREYPQEEVVKRIAHLREIAGIAIDRSL
ncbi:MAG: flagellar protein FlaG [Alphaproteobacteria bacterium]|nr:flagellar protein FlaG [Alphaproteobacteria bacterium]